METAQAQKLIHGEPPGFNRNYRKRPKEETEDHSTKILFFHTKWEVNIMNYRTVTFFLLSTVTDFKILRPHSDCKQPHLIFQI